MDQRLPRYCFLSLLLVCTTLQAVGEPYVVDGNDNDFYLNDIGEYVTDIDANTPAELLEKNPTFQPMTPNQHGQVVPSQILPVWFRFTLRNRETHPVEVFMSMSYISMDYWDVFIPTENDFDTIQLGDQRPFTNRRFLTGPYVSAFTIGPGEEQTYYLRAQSRGQLVIPVHLFTGDAYYAHQNMRTAYSMAFIGVAVGLFLFSLMLGIQTRDIIYIIYSVLVLMRIMQLVISEGTVYYWLEHFPTLQQMSLIMLSSLYTCSSLLFHTFFLRFNELYPRLNKFVIGVIGFFFICGVILPFINYSLAVAMISSAIVFINPFLIISAVVRIVQGYRPAIFYLSAVIFPIAVTSYGSAAWSGTVPYYDTTSIFLGLAFSVGLVLFSFALSARIKTLDSERALAENEAMQARVEAQTKSDFLAQMSHEIRTPMNGVLGISELMAKTQLDEQQKKYNNIINSSGKLLLQVIDDVLDYSKIQAGKMSIEKIKFDLRLLLEETREIFLPKINEKKLNFSIEVDDAVPATLCGDPTRIRQILFNLVNNAYKFTESGGLTLSASMRAEDGKCRIAIKDTGVGISTSAQQHLFMPYYQTSKSTTRKYGGTGLGLSICKQLCELMGGEIGVISDVGKGAEFWFALPLEVSANQQVQPANNEASTSPANYKPLHFLVAEDNPVNQIVVQGMLSTLGHTCRTVGNGREAVDVVLANRQEFDAVLMDCDMPELDGIAATREIRASESGHSIPIIALTAHALGDQVVTCINAGMNDHLSKPLKINDLKTICQRYQSAT